MNWEQIKELYSNKNVEIGNHSHSHEYLVDESPETIKKDVKSIEILKNLNTLKVFLAIWR